MQSYTIWLNGHKSSEKIAVIKTTRHLLGVDLRAAYNIVTSAQASSSGEELIRIDSTLSNQSTMHTAIVMRNQLEKAGALVEIRDDNNNIVDVELLFKIHTKNDKLVVSINNIDMTLEQARMLMVEMAIHIDIAVIPKQCEIVIPRSK